MRRVRRWWLLGGALIVMVFAAVVVNVGSVAINVATSGKADWWPSVNEHPVRWMVAATVAAGVIAFVVWRVHSAVDRTGKERRPARVLPEKWAVDRPDEVRAVVAGLCRRGGSTVGITTAVHGAGGFGKTTVAKMAAVDRRVLRRFGEHVYWVLLGRDARSASEICAKVNDLISRLDPDGPRFVDVKQAADHLATVLLNGRRRLIVLDDVWYPEQEAAFPVAGRAVRLLTTRIPSLVHGQSVPVRVDQVTVEQARAMLTADLPALPTAVEAGLLAITGRWPLLVRLVNKAIAVQFKSHTDIAAVSCKVLRALTDDGRLHVDNLTGAAAKGLKVDDPEERREVVRLTIAAGTGLLTADERVRFHELGVFAEDEAVPIALIATLWRTTGGIDDLATRALCHRLDALALVSVAGDAQGGTVQVHDVIREFIRGEAGEGRLFELHGLMLDGVAATLPAPRSWWELSASERYLWDHLVEHLLESGRRDHAHDLAIDLRWVAARLDQAGPAAPAADLARFDTEQSAELTQVLTRNAHLLLPSELPHNRVDILLNVLADDPKWNEPATSLGAQRTGARLVIRKSFRAPASTSPRRTIPTDMYIQCLAIAPDGTWFALAGIASPVRVIDVATGDERIALHDSDTLVYSIAISPDGTWLTSVGFDGAVRVWDIATGHLRFKRKAHKRPANGVAVSPDSTWLASVSADGTISVREATNGSQRNKITVGGPYTRLASVCILENPIRVVAVCDYGTVFVSDPGARNGGFSRFQAGTKSAFSADGILIAGMVGNEVRVSELESYAELSTFTGHLSRPAAIALSPDGCWGVSGEENGAIRLWDSATGAERATLDGHTGEVKALAISPDGTWLLSAGADKIVRIWDVPAVADAPQARSMTSATIAVRALAAPKHGQWLAVCDDDGAIRLQAADSGDTLATLDGALFDVRMVAAAQDGTWLAASGPDYRVQLWDVASGASRVIATDQVGGVTAIAPSSDGAMIICGGLDGTVRVRDTVTGALLGEFTGHSDWVRSAAFAPDGTWFASVGNAEDLSMVNLATGTTRTLLTEDGYWPHLLAIAPDGSIMLTGLANYGVKVWDVGTGNLERELGAQLRGLTDLAFSPDGASIATTYEDGTVRVWGAQDGEVVAMTRIDGPARCCAWIRDSRSIAVGSTKGLYLFDVRRS